jgi:hypothetical protein
MNMVWKLGASLAVAGLFLSASPLAGEVGASGDRGWRPRDAGEHRGRRPEGPPLLGDVKGMKEELETHRANMKALQDQLAEVMGKPGEKKEGGTPETAEARKEALAAKVDQIAPAIIDEFVRHYQAVAELLKADREEAVKKLKERMMSPPGGNRGPGGPGDRPPPQGGGLGEAPDGEDAGGAPPVGEPGGGRLPRSRPGGR